MMLEYSKINLFEQTIFTFYCWNAKPVADCRNNNNTNNKNTHKEREKKYIKMSVWLVGHFTLADQRISLFIIRYR